MGTKAAKTQWRNTEKACFWFAMCDREATCVVAHPILGDVPCCGRCARFAKGVKA